MNLAEFHRALELVSRFGSGALSGPSLSDLSARLFRSLDANGDGVVDFLELCSGFSLYAQSDSAEAKIKAAFVLFDASGDGYISRDELVVYLRAIFQQAR